VDTVLLLQHHAAQATSALQGNILSNVVLFDSMIPTWQNKNLYDAVRPFTAIRTVYGNNVVTAWGGPGPDCCCASDMLDGLPLQCSCIAGVLKLLSHLQIYAVNKLDVSYCTQT
jgi:hypothetical protein